MGPSQRTAPTRGQDSMGEQRTPIVTKSPAAPGSSRAWVRGLSRLGAGLGSLLVVLSCALLGGFTLMNTAGYHPLTVLSGSMEPAIRTGDLIVDQTISPLRAQPGDVVTFSDPVQKSRTLTHRVVRRRLQGTAVHFVTRGDANTGVERWTVPADGKIGIVRMNVWKAGYVLAWTRTPTGRIGLIVFPVLFLAAWSLARIWRLQQVPA